MYGSSTVPEMCSRNHVHLVFEVTNSLNYAEYSPSVQLSTCTHSLSISSHKLPFAIWIGCSQKLSMEKFMSQKRGLLNIERLLLDL